MQSTIVTDAEACRDADHACIRGARRITGGGCDGGYSALAEEAAPDAPVLNYRFAPLSPPGTDEIAAAATERYCAGFSTLAFFPVEDTVWGIFAAPGQPEP